MKSSPETRYTGRRLFICLSCLFLLPFILLNQASAEQVKVGVYSNKPLVFQDKDGQIQGLTIDVLRYIAEKEGWELEFIQGSWPECLQRLENGEIDLQVAIAVSSERKKLFSYPSQTLITNWGRLYRYPGVSAESLLDLDGKTVAFLEKDIHSKVFFNLMDKFSKRVQPVALGSYDEVLEQVQAGNVDVGIVNRMYAMQNGHNFKVEATPMIFNPIEVRFAAPKGQNSNLLEAIDRHLADLRANKNSVYYRSLEKWFGHDKVITIPGWIQPVLLIVCGLLVLVIAISMFLKRQVAAGTKELKGANDRLKAQVHQLQKTEEALAESEKQFKTFFNNANDAIFVHLMRSEGFAHFIAVNDIACVRYGYSREEFLQLSPADLNRIDKVELAKVEKFRQELIKTGRQIFETVHFNKSGEKLQVEVNATVIDIESDDPLILSVVRDISQRRQNEEEKQELSEELNKAKRMESIGLLAGGVAHDLNNILSGIVGYPELMLQKLPEDSELRGPLEAVHESGKRAATVVADLLMVARGAVCNREIHNINVLIGEYLDSPEYIKLNSLHLDITCQQQLEASPATILCSPVHVKKCLMNLVTNGSEAIGNNGIITIATHNQYVDETTGAKHNMRAGQYVVLKVEDTGPGISDVDMEHIFEPFYTKKIMGRSGTGLGLTVVWNTMEAHSGKIFVESSVKGTCFQLYFPVSKVQAVVQPENNKTEQKYQGNCEHILVIDDETQLRDIAGLMLQSMNYKIDSMASGEAAVDFLKDNSVDLIVIDMLMEPGMNGRQTYEKILEIYPEQKAVIASGFSESDDVKATLKLGAGGFIKKPYSMDELGKAVQEVLAG